MGKNFSPVQTLFPWDFFPAWIAGTLWGEMTEVRCLLWVFPHAPRNAGIAAAPASSHQGSRGPFSSGRDGCGMRDLGCGTRDAGFGTRDIPRALQVPPALLLGTSWDPVFPQKTLFWGLCPRLVPAGRSRTGSPAGAGASSLCCVPSCPSSPVTPSTPGGALWGGLVALESTFGVG